MANSNLKTLSEIFNDKIFKIPDYQRGYSWEEPQLEDLWRDIDNLPLNKFHYTGMITVDMQNDDIFHVIDGQQRLTSLIILIKNITTKYEDDWIATIKKDKVIEKYLYEETENKKNPKIKFGYYKNNSSYYFYKTKILSIQDKTNKDNESTLYTANLDFANTFFKDKLNNKNKNELEELFIKLHRQLKFSWHEIEKTDDLDKYVIFETMNNRGKPLSVLEILKNRLIYITTLLNDINDSDKKKLRDDINDVWKIIFEYLGKDKRMEEDWFLRYNIAIIWGISKIKNEDFHREHLLNTFFTIQKIFNKNEISYLEANKLYESFRKLYNEFTHLKVLKENRSKIIKIDSELFDIVKKIQDKLMIQLKYGGTEDKEEHLDYFTNDYHKNGKQKETILNNQEMFDFQADYILENLTTVKEKINNTYFHYDLIEDYISSLKDSIKSYYYILNPTKSKFDEEIKYWLKKINTIGTKGFMPILICIFNLYDKKNNKIIIEILQDVEKYLFVKNYCWGSEKTIFLNQDYYKATKLYSINKDIKSFNNALQKLLYNFSNNLSSFGSHKFIEKIRGYFEEGKGYYEWSGIKYVLYEYEVSLQEKYGGDFKILWENINKESIEHIYPQTPKDTWIDSFRNLKGNKQRTKYANSIGNLLLLSKKKNSKASNKPFKDKKEIYSSGSFNEIEVSKYEEWTTKEINERSEKILSFMNNRWNLGLKIADINKLK